MMVKTIDREWHAICIEFGTPVWPQWYQRGSRTMKPEQFDLFWVPSDPGPGGLSMREYIRHPSDIPVELEVERPHLNRTQHLKNVSVGGLSFCSGERLEPDAIVRIRIPLVDPAFQAKGRVAWCRPSGERYEVGIELLAKEEAFRARMVEQICHIEHYKQRVERTEGRHLSSEEAAQEWIGRYAGNFPAWKARAS